MNREKLEDLFYQLEKEMEVQKLTRVEFDTITGWRLRLWYSKKHDEREKIK